MAADCGMYTRYEDAHVAVIEVNRAVAVAMALPWKKDSRCLDELERRRS